MSRFTSPARLGEAIRVCREQCRAQDIPFFADALAAALHLSYDRLMQYAAGEGVSARVAEELSAALQECTASVLAYALRADPKQHGLYMWYLRNRAGFSDKGGDPPRGTGGVTFVGEERI